MRPRSNSGQPPLLARVTGASQAVANGTHTKLDINAVEADPYGIVDLVNDRIVLPKTGYWRVFGQGSWPVGQTASALWYVCWNNNVADIRVSYCAPGTASPLGPGASLGNTVLCRAGDTIHMGVYQITGGSVNIGVLNFGAEFVGVA